MNIPNLNHATQIDSEEYYRYLEVLPPIYVDTLNGTKVKSGFVVSEPVSSEGSSPTFTMCWQDTESALYYKCQVTVKGITFGNYNDKEFSAKHSATSVIKPYDFN